MESMLKDIGLFYVCIGSINLIFDIWILFQLKRRGFFVKTKPETEAELRP